jgi:hypothetical protein
MNDDIPKPKLNQPVETGITAGEEFAQNVLGRMSRAHEQFVDLNNTVYAPTKADQERLEKFREESFAHIEQVTGLTFDRQTGKCTTEGSVKMEGELRGRWAQMCTRLREERDPQKAEELVKQAAALLRGAIEPDETGAIDGEKTEQDS